MEGLKGFIEFLIKGSQNIYYLWIICYWYHGFILLKMSVVLNPDPGDPQNCVSLYITHLIQIISLMLWCSTCLLDWHFCLDCPLDCLPVIWPLPVCAYTVLDLLNWIVGSLLLAIVVISCEWQAGGVVRLLFRPRTSKRHQRREEMLLEGKLFWSKITLCIDKSLIINCQFWFHGDINQPILCRVSWPWFL